MWLDTEATYQCKEDGHLFDAGDGNGYATYKSKCVDLGIYDLGLLWTNRIPECKAGLKEIPREYSVMETGVTVNIGESDCQCSIHVPKCDVLEKINDLSCQ